MGFWSMAFRLRLPFWPKKKDYSKVIPKEPKTRLGKAWKASRVRRKLQESRVGRAWHRTIGFRRGVKLASKRALYLLALMHVLSNLAYFGNYAKNKIAPSEVRREFARLHGVELQGWRADIEASPQMITIMGEVVRREKLQGHFGLSWLKVESDNYFKKHFLDQMSAVFTRPHAGYAERTSRHISMSTDLNSYLRSTLHHEIKHIKSYDVIRKRPEFEREWRKLAHVNGSDAYLTAYENVKKWVPLAGEVDPKKLDSDACLRLGFIRPYARTNFYEDVACLGEAVEDHSERNRLADLVFGKKPNPLIKAKLKLLEKYKLIPPEFTEYLRLHMIGHEWAMRHAPHGYWEEPPSIPLDEYFAKTESFLRKHPKTQFESEIRANRAWIMAQRSTTKQSYEAAIQEYLRVLQCDPSQESYSNALSHLEELYHTVENPTLAKVMRDAYMEYYRRFDMGDPALSVVGVNDILVKAGVFKR